MSRYSKLVAYSLMISGALPAYAQGRPASVAADGGVAADADHGRIADIVVTARRQSESLQRTPVAVTALNIEELKTAQVSNVADLQRTAPSLSVATGAPSGGAFAFVAIRGQGALNASVAVDPSVAIYVDGVYIARPSQGLIQLSDLAQVEVLRGPQGTLFGRNTVGGALSIMTGDPVDQLEGRVRATYGNYDNRQISTLLNVPLSDTLAIRGTYDFQKRDGYGYNPILDREAANILSHNGRFKLKWQPKDSDWSVIIGGDYSRLKDKGQIVGLRALDPAAVPLSLLPSDIPTPENPTPPPLISVLSNLYTHTKDNWYETYQTGYGGPNVQLPNPLPFNDTKAYGGSATIEGRISDLNFKSITAYRYSNANGFLDLDGTPAPILANESGYLSKAWSQELQLSGDLTDQLSFITGLYASYEKGQEFSDFQPFGILGVPIARNDGLVRNTTYGAYLQGYYKLTDRLRLAAGLRWAWDKRKAVLRNVNLSGAPGDLMLPTGPNCAVTPDGGDLAACQQSLSANFNYPAWTLGLDYEAAEGLFLYAKTSRASHAGGWNLRVGSVPAFKPERVTDVEVGVKADMLDRRLRLNFAAFHSWTHDSQRVVSGAIPGSNPPVSTSSINNSGNFQIDGVELEVTALPWAGMQLTGSLSYMDGKYDRGTFIEQRVDPVTSAIYAFDRSAEPLEYLPGVQLSVGATQTVDLTAGVLALHADYSYVASQHFFTGTFDPRDGVPASAVNSQNMFGKIPGYGLVNARIAFTLHEPEIEIALFGRNLAQKKYLTRTFPDLYTSIGQAVEYVGEPRMYGLSVSYRFGR